MSEINVRSTDDTTRHTTFLDGSKRNIIELGAVFIGKGVYKPGWRWSTHAGAISGKQSEAHIGFIVSGRMGVKDSTGNEVELNTGDSFEVGPNHDAWVLGDESCVALDIQVK